MVAADKYAVSPAFSPKCSMKNSSDKKYSITLIIIITDSRVGSIFKNCFEPFFIPLIVFVLSAKKEIIVTTIVDIINGDIFNVEN